MIEIHASIQDYMQEHVLHMAHPNFHDDLIRDITYEYIELWTDAGIVHTDTDTEEVQDAIESLIDDYFTNEDEQDPDIPIRSHKTTLIRKTPNINIMQEKIATLQLVEQPTQRTPEWYEFRHGLITASNLSKVFGSAAQVNSLIYEKCQPLVVRGTDINNYVNTESPMHWGQKYEPLSVMLYERDYATIVSDFGCIRHPTCPCIGASPDGINVSPISERYGRMLEIKNIVNREITGIPKEAYWIQMQIQMETCDLDECDFLETRFCEYPDEDEFYQDTEREDRGIILYMVSRVSMGDITHLNIATTSNTPHYEYMPLDIPLDKESVDEWIHLTRQRLRRDWSLYTTLYWYLAESSCVLVERNRAWFQAAKPKIEEVWQIILKERETGYEHRASKKRSSKDACVPANNAITVIKEGTNDTPHTYRVSTGSICLVKLEAEHDILS
jgi:putative phage-type endonuclease